MAISDPTAVEKRLKERIHERGPISFAEFMEEALYGDGGYYARPELAIGRHGDYVTGSSFSPLFARSTARLLGRLDEQLGVPAEMLEVGYGGGVHLVGVASAVRQGLRSRRIRGVDRVDRPLPELSVSAAASVETLTGLGSIGRGEIEGLIFAYELFDALPVHRLVALEGGGCGELRVTLDEHDGFTWIQADLSDPSWIELLGAESDLLNPGQIVDLAPGWGPLYSRLARRLGRGLLVVCDYGYERRRLLDPRVRMHGTLACYSRQQVHRNPFVEVGNQDLTAHVDFTALREAGEAEGLETVAFGRQAGWLAACGLFEDLQGAADETRREAMKLLDGEGMGQDLRVLVQARRVAADRLFDISLLG